MGVWYKLFICAVVSMLCFHEVRAEKVACPEGCFCLNNGKVDLDLIKIDYGWTGSGYDTKQAMERLEGICQGSSTTFPATENFGCHIGGYKKWFWTKEGQLKLVCDWEKYFADYPGEQNTKLRYFLEDFSELYSGSFGAYGIINNEAVYISESAYYDNTFQCPFPYPLSKSGAKTVNDCFRYNAKGEKGYYPHKSVDSVSEKHTCTNDNPSIKSGDNGWFAGVVCQPGNYMPANSTTCKKCGANDNCPGGFFYTDKSYNVDRGIVKGKSETAIISDKKIKVTSVKPSKMQSGIRKAGKLQIHR